MDLCCHQSTDDDHHTINPSSDSLPPISHLPTELLIEVFVACTANEPIIPITLSSVCRFWREVVTSSPRIWQLISLDDHRRPIPSCRAQAELWLAQSSPLQFDVVLDIQSSDSLLSLLSPFLSSITRWRHCWINGTRQEHLQVSRLYNPIVIPTLHYLNLNIQPNEDSGDQTHMPPTFYVCSDYFESQTPQRVSMNISLTTLPPVKHLTTLQFTFLNVTEVSFDIYLQPAQLLHFLVACPLLEQFFFCGGTHDDEPSEDILPVVHLLHLHTLLIRNTCSQRTILSHLHTPILRQLLLQSLNLDFELRRYIPIEEGDSDDEDPDYSQSPWSDHHTGMGLRRLITRSNPPLEVLDMDFSDMRAKDFLWCFDRLSSLTCFRIIGSDMSNNVINLFGPVLQPLAGDSDTTPRVAKIRLPRLSVLKLYNCQRFSGEAVADAISSRVKYTDEVTPTSTLQDLTIVNCMDFLPLHAEKLSADLGERLHIA